METIVLAGILILLLVSGTLAALWPEKVVAFRNRMSWSDSLLSGGYFYATARRARVTGLTVVALAVVMFLLKIT
jgi:hypothetical protein